MKSLPKNLQAVTAGLSFSYHFSPEEITALALFLRRRQHEIPEGLEEFAAAVERVIYDSMSIEEAGQFYS